jgi:hypothetical protein
MLRACIPVLLERDDFVGEALLLLGESGGKDFDGADVVGEAADASAVE